MSFRVGNTFVQSLPNNDKRGSLNTFKNLPTVLDTSSECATLEYA